MTFSKEKSPVRNQAKTMVEVYEAKMPQNMAARSSNTAEKIIKRLECVD